MKERFNVKSKSAYQFLKDNLLNQINEGNGLNDNTSAYHLLHDEMIFKKNNGIEIGQIIVIELFDKSEFSRKELVNTYEYQAKKYDDVSIKMVLKSFSVYFDTNCKKDEK